MKLDARSTALECRTRGAPRRVVVTDVASGEQRLVKAADVGARSAQGRSSRSGSAAARAAWRRRRRAACSSPCTCRRRGWSSPARCISARRWRRSARLARLRRHHRRSAHRLRHARALSRREGDRRMARRGAAAARHRPLHRVRRAHPRSEDRRSGAHPCARARLLLYRRARLEEDACAARRAAEGAGRRPTPTLARIHAPIGLDIGAVSPPEIAVAIMGEITARLRCAAEEAREGGMKFGAVPVAEAEGGVAVHSIRQGGAGAQEGHPLIGQAEIAALKAAGIGEIVVARLEPGDVSARTRRRRDRRRGRRARACASTAPSPAAPTCSPSSAACWWSTSDAIDRLNRVDEAITFATLAGLQAGGRRRDDRDRQDHPVRGAGAAARRRARGGAATAPLMRVAPYRIRKVGVVSTLLPGLAEQGDREDARGDRRAARARRRRASSPSGACRTSSARSPRRSRRCSAPAPSSSSSFGASAIADRRDVIPAAIEAVGGAHRAFRHAGRSRQPAAGRPRAGRPVLGAPGCARSPKENGFDWVLMRLLAGLPVTRADITGMGVGGLLMEIVTRPQPREEPAPASPAASPRSCSRPAARPAWAGRTSCSPRSTAPAGAHRRRAGAGLAARAGDRRHRPPARAGRGGARRPAGATRPQSGFRARGSRPRSRPASRRCRRMPTAPSSASATCRRSTRR